MGPGSLYTSIMPNMLITGLYKELVASKALKIYICNVMTQHGETDNYKASDHLKAILAHTSPEVITHCVVNTGKVPDKLLGKYKLEKASPVAPDVNAIEKMGYKVIQGNVISTTDYVRHDSVKLAKMIGEFASSI